MTTTLLHHLSTLITTPIPTSPLSTPSTSHTTLSTPLPTTPPTSQQPPTPENPPGKIFVGGLSWETDETSLRDYFSKYGPVLETTILRDRHTGHPRGFGFVTFASKDTANLTSTIRHQVDGRFVEAKIAVPRHSLQQTSSSFGSVMGVGGLSGVVVGNKKVFVGGLPPMCKEEELEEYFGRFGKVSERVIMYDRVTGNSRGFGFVSFEEEGVVGVVCGDGGESGNVGRHEIMGKVVEVKRAEPRVFGDGRRKNIGIGGVAAPPPPPPPPLLLPGMPPLPPPGFLPVNMNMMNFLQLPFPMPLQPPPPPPPPPPTALSLQPPIGNSTFLSPVPTANPSPASSSSSLQSVSPWDQASNGTSVGKNMWSTGYLERSNEGDDGLKEVLDRVMNLGIGKKEDEGEDEEDNRAYKLFK